jgi:hypothetical protein
MRAYRLKNQKRNTHIANETDATTSSIAMPLDFFGWADGMTTGFISRHLDSVSSLVGHPTSGPSIGPVV